MAVKKDISIFFLLAICSGLFSCNREEKGGLPDMRTTLAFNDAAPMGGKVFKTIAAEVFGDYSFESNPQPFNTWHQSFLEDSYKDIGSAYVVVSPYVNAHQKEVEQMKEFISNGNTMLMITNGVSQAFKDAFGPGIRKLPFTFGKNRLMDTFKYLGDSTSTDTTRYGYFFYPLDAIFDTVLPSKQVTRNMFGQPDGLEIEVGSGKLVLVANAEAVSNYFLLSGENYRYAVGLLSHLNFNPDEIYWDEFYRRNINRPDENQSIFSAILANPALRWAFWLLLALCGIAILTNLFRRQRIIPVRKPNRNTTVEFTQTIARLYYNKKDNRNIALKMIQHFMEHIRTNFYLPHQKLDDAFAAVLAGKTNQPVPKTQRLVTRMSNIQQGAEVSDEQLLELNRQLTELLKPVLNK